jgi:hypothetical protein
MILAQANAPDTVLRAQQPSAAQSTSLQALKQYVGQMPLEMLKQEPKIGERLAKLLGKEYSHLQDRLAHPAPIQLVGDVLILMGEKPFTVGNPKAIVGIALGANKLHCAMVENNSRSIFSEDPQKIPNEFNSFMVKKDINDGKKKTEKKDQEADKKN